MLGSFRQYRSRPTAVSKVRATQVEGDIEVKFSEDVRVATKGDWIVMLNDGDGSTTVMTDAEFRAAYVSRKTRTVKPKENKHA